MIYALIHYPNFDHPRLDQFRKKYDVQVNLIALHITLMFPVPESMGEENLVHHLENVLHNWQPFPIHLQGVQISPDDHVFLMLQKGNAEILRLHSEIYTGILVDYRREDIPFVPHLTLGVLNQDSNEHDHVLEEAKQLDIDHHSVLDKLHLVKVNDDRSKIVWSKEFSLAEQHHL